MARPDLVDNLADGIDHRDALRYLLADTATEHGLAIATGYVNLGGLLVLAETADERGTRLLIGAEPDAGLGANLPPIDRFQLQLEALAGERDFSRFPPSRQVEKLVAVAEWLERDDVEVRRYTDRFLHGKAYLLGSSTDARVALVSSANLTWSGLTHNLELGLTNYEPLVTKHAIDWFDGLWDASIDFKEALAELLFPDASLLDPQTIYLRALLELHSPESDDPTRPTRPAIELAEFQRDGYERARAIAREHGGVVYADGVGTGKTEIGLAFIEERTKEDGVYALVVTPAQLVERWRERIDRARLPAQVISFNQLATDEQLNPPGPGIRRRLNNAKDAYRLIVVDEAHSLRNEDTSWYRAMERLLGGARKEVVLLTATPINNGLWDLYNMVMLFARHDRAFSGAGIDSIRQLFVDAGANERDPENLSPEVLYPLADAVSVRRDRRFIEREYPGAHFPNGIPVRFPKPLLQTVRYDLDAAHPGLFDAIVADIDALSMARYQPSRYELEPEELAREAQLAGLIKSGVLKRFESCWFACLQTVERMCLAHEAFLAAWERGAVLPSERLREIAGEGDGEDETGLAALLDDALEWGEERSAEEFEPEYRIAVALDLERLRSIAATLRRIDPADDTKLAALRDLLDSSQAQKVAVFATYAATIHYLDENLPAELGGRVRVTVIGGETSPDERTEAMGRFAPDTVVEPGYVPPGGEVDLLLATDVISEGQNLQQAQQVVSYDMPWNPQRVVQRNGRVIRLMSEHDEVFLWTMLPKAGELEELLGLESRIQGKIKAASGVYGMESEVIEELEKRAAEEVAGDLTSFASKLAGGDEGVLFEAEDDSGAFIGEELRRMIDRAVREGTITPVLNLPWGVGACFRQAPGGRSSGAPGIFLAFRTPPTLDEREGFRYWRYVEEGGALISNDLEILRRIDPEGGADGDADGIDLEGAWQRAAADVVEAHNRRTDLRSEEERVGPKQRWALDLLRDPAVALPAGADVDNAYESLTVERSSAVRRALGDVQAALTSEAISADAAAARVVGVVDDFGLRPVAAPPPPPRIDVDDLGVVCWMAVQGGGA